MDHYSNAVTNDQCFIQRYDYPPQKGTHCQMFRMIRGFHDLIFYIPISIEILRRVAIMKYRIILSF